MMTVKEVSKLTGVSIRALHYYDQIGLLTPAVTTEAGYRLYDDTNLDRLQQILLFRELEFPLKEIKRIMDSPGFHRKKALTQQIELLTLKKEHIENLISFARIIQTNGGYEMSFQAFDKQKIRDYEAQAKKTWGNTEAYREYEERTAEHSQEQEAELGAQMMGLFTEFGALRDKAPEDAAVQAQVKKLQDFITDHYYTCTNQILGCLGQMYAAGGEMTDNIDAAGGAGTAVFAAAAIDFYCK